MAADLGKNDEYYKAIYGAPKSEKRVADYAFSLPGHGSIIRVVRPLLVQQYESNKLKVAVIYPDTARDAIWVKYTLPNPWTAEQISAALKAYAPNWKIVEESAGMTLIMGQKAPVVYLSNGGVLAYKTMVDELIIYAPQLYADLRNQVAEEERQKKAVPKF